MPYKDPQEKIEAMRRWRKSSTPEYHKWLYKRRSFRFSKAEKFEQVLRVIANKNVDAANLAAHWLAYFDAEETRIGRFFDHAANRPTNERTVTTRSPGPSGVA